MSTGPGGSENLQTGEAVARIPDQWDAIRWGQSKSGYVPAGGRDDYADRAGLPRLPQSQNGLEHLDAAFAQSKRWHPPREASEFDPARSGTPPPGFRRGMSPVSDPRVSVTRQPRPRRPAMDWQP